MLRRGILLVLCILAVFAGANPICPPTLDAAAVAREAAEHRQALDAFAEEVAHSRRRGASPARFLAAMRDAALISVEVDGVAAMAALTTEISRVQRWLAVIERQAETPPTRLPLVVLDEGPTAACCHDPVQPCFSCPHAWRRLRPQGARSVHEAPALQPLTAAIAWLAERFPGLPLYAPSY